MRGSVLRAEYATTIAEVLRSGGFPRTQGGTLYPLLRRLEEQGLVSHKWQHDTAGPGRKQFAITDEGRAELTRAAERRRRTSSGLRRSTPSSSRKARAGHAERSSPPWPWQCPECTCWPSSSRA
ncbi:PadR family transcriptional regulator [Arthrobacter globiformis]|uniref:PadR family transcriptional regulator n=1 Tax=Arthrobacter globiformis TaxID=1665 RepID=UPI0027D8EDE2|nr:PadR family transcriptional regulator [Arthrobacter globiformis]